MKKRTLFLFALTLLLSVNISLSAQAGGVKLEPRVQKLAREIELTDAQKQQLNKIAIEFTTAMKASMQITDSVAQLQARIQAQEKYKLASDSVLTNTQKDELLKRREKRQQEINKKLK